MRIRVWVTVGSGSEFEETYITIPDEAINCLSAEDQKQMIDHAAYEAATDLLQFGWDEV